MACFRSNLLSRFYGGCAERVTKEMCSKDLQCDVVSFNSVMQACASHSTALVNRSQQHSRNSAGGVLEMSFLKKQELFVNRKEFLKML